MADFCKECSEKYFGEDFRDLAYIVTEEQVLRGCAARVLCEGCLASATHDIYKPPVKFEPTSKTPSGDLPWLELVSVLGGHEPPRCLAALHLHWPGALLPVAQLFPRPVYSYVVVIIV